MKLPTAVFAAALAVIGMGASPGVALAAAVPVVQGTTEVGIPEDGGRMLLVYGQNLTKVTAYELDESDGTLIAPLTVVFKSKTLVGLALPASLVPPTYDLPGEYSLKFSTKTATNSVLIRITGGRVEAGSVGAASLDSGLRTDLDDAATVGGETPASLHDAGLLTGSLSLDAFSAYDDLADEGKVGSGMGQIAAGDHLHDSRYPLRSELNAAGVINSMGNPVHWTQLIGVPAGIADGVDDSGAGSYAAGSGLTLTTGTFAVDFSGTGSAATVSRSDHNHDAAYYKKSDLNAAGGTLNDGANPVDWSRLKNVPAGFADGADATASYLAGTGLTLTGSTFSVNFGSTSTTVSAGNHTHSNYLGTGDGTITGTLTINSSTKQAIIATSGDTSGTVGGIDCVTAGGIGVKGSGNIGVMGDVDSDGTWGVYGKATYSNQIGVYAYANSGQYDSSSTALKAYHYWGGTGVYAKSYSGNGLYARSYGGNAIYARRTGGYGTVVRVNGSYGNTGVYSYVGNNGTGMYARASNYGQGLYARAGNYGTGVNAVGGYKGAGLRASSYGSYCTGIQSSAYGYGAYGLRVRGGNTRNLSVFQYYGYNVARIDFKGRGYFNGGTYTSGADFAESVRVDRPAAEFEPGDVMVIDPKAPRQFALSRDANSPLVAGVISTKPALVGSLHNVADARAARKLKEEVKLGVVGIVPTKVCDEGGPIRIGDLLVSASRPGHAMKAPANPAVGTVIGKALGALDGGTGKVEVLLMAR